MIQMRASGEADVYIFEDIGERWDGSGLSAKKFAESFDALMKKNPKAINVHLNSPGGDVIDGVAIANTIKRAQDKTTVFIDGWAASIASVIALAGRKSVMASNALYMIHNPWGIAIGDAKVMEKKAEVLNVIKATLLDTYARKTNKTSDEIAAKMDAVTWFTAQEALDYGFADEISEEVKVTNQLSPDAWRAWNKTHTTVQAEAPTISAPTPDEPKEESAMADPKTESPKPATIRELEAACVGASPEFLCAQLKAEATVDDAMRAYQKVQAEALAAKDKAIEDLQKKVDKQAKSEVVSPGVAPVTESIKASTESLDIEAQWAEAIKAKVALGITKKQAISAVSRENPDLHKAYLAAYNARIRMEA